MNPKYPQTELKEKMQVQEKFGTGTLGIVLCFDDEAVFIRFIGEKKIHEYSVREFYEGFLEVE